MYSLFGLLNDNIGSSLCWHLVGEKANLGTFLTIDVYFLSVLTVAHVLQIQDNTNYYAVYMLFMSNFIYARENLPLIMN